MRPIRCDTCNEMFGVIDGEYLKALCWHCAADLVFPSPGSAPRDSAAMHPSSEPGDLLFKCPKCGLVKKWQLQRPPWPGAICYDCYQALAESMGAGREVP